jgi:hypothetical protein
MTRLVILRLLVWIAAPLVAWVAILAAGAIIVEGLPQ